MKRCLLHVLVITILLNFHTIPSQAATVTQPALFIKGDCKLVIEDAHISAYLLKRKINPIRAVKANLVSDCRYPQQKVVFQIWFLKKINGKWVKSKGFFKFANSPLPNPFYVEIKDAYVKCKNRRLTWYLIQARSWTTISGKEYPSKVGISQNPTRLFCGI